MNTGSHIAGAIELADTGVSQGGLSTTDFICIIHELHVTQMLGFFDDGFHLLLHSKLPLHVANACAVDGDAQ